MSYKKDNLKIAVAMSGGVDSSVAAALMVEKYGPENVFGVTMRLFCYGRREVDEKSCCSLEAISDAKSVCDKLGIPHYTINLEKEFEKAVVTDFIQEYQKGRTPIPCIPCNTLVKFEYLMRKVQILGAEKLVTGHYARVAQGSGHYSQDAPQRSDLCKYQLLRGVDTIKDQSYFLYGLNQAQLARIEFPLGGMKKTDVRRIAKKLGLKTAEKKESQGICFVTEGRVTDWLKGKVKIKPGKIIDTKGNTIGEHEGVIFYTVGQRKRIGGGHAEPMYVVRIEAKKNWVVIGTRKDLFQKKALVEGVSWVAGQEPKLPKKCSAKVRYNMESAPCTIRIPKANIPKGKLEVIFAKPQRAITPGQSAIFYDGDVVLGGGKIT